MTETQLATAFSIAQQTIADYACPLLCYPALLAVSVDDLIGELTKEAQSKRGPTPRLQRQVELVNQPPRTKQKFVMDMLDAVLQKQTS